MFAVMSKVKDYDQDISNYTLLYPAMLSYFDILGLFACGLMF